MNLKHDEVQQELLTLAVNAYVPYSHFRVAYILYLKNGSKIVGVNVENAAYNPTICAERCALPQLYAQGYNADDVALMALYTDAAEVDSPCGTCRQTMVELLHKSQEVWMYSKKGYCGTYTVGDFLPFSFTKSDLESNKN